MKIAHLTTSLELGGSERALERLIYADKANVHRVICLHEDGVIGPRLRNKGIEVDLLHLPRQRLPRPRAILDLRRLLRKDPPDVLQAWMYHANLLSALVGKAGGAHSICWNIRRTGFHENTLPASTKLVARFGALLSHFVPRKIVYCAYSASEWHARFGYDSKRAAVIQNGIDLEQFSPCAAAGQAIRSELGLLSSDPVIGMVARFHPDKDHATLLTALKRVISLFPRLKCLLVGSGTEPGGPLAMLAQKAGIADHVFFLGPRSDLPAVMNALDLHVTSSVTEGFPNVIAEAMACCTPCVSTDVGDARLVIGKEGWVVPPCSPDLLADAIAEALSLQTRDQWPLLRQSARSRVKSNFTISKMVDQYHDLWSTVPFSQSTNGRE